MYLVLKVCCRTSKKCRYYVLLTICLANSTQPVYAVVLALKWDKCGMYPRMHARTRTRKVLLWEAASLSFLRATLGRRDTGSNERSVLAGGEAAETQV